MKKPVQTEASLSNALEKLRQAIEGMTAGPWSVAENFPAWEIHHPSQYGIPAVGIRIGGNYGNAQGIALLRNVAPALLDVVEAAGNFNEVFREWYFNDTWSRSKMAIYSDRLAVALSALEAKLKD